MRNFLKVMGMAIIILISACQENSTEIQAEKDTWNWRFDQIKEQENVVLMNDHIRTASYKQALEIFEWVITENPKLHPSIYESGLIIYQGLIDEIDEPKRKHQLKIEREKIIQLKKKHFPAKEEI